MDCDELEKARARQQVLPLLRLWVGMPAQDLAKEFHVAKETVSCWEHGKQLTEKIDDVLRFLCKKAGWNWEVFRAIVLHDPLSEILQDRLEVIKRRGGATKTREARAGEPGQKTSRDGGC